MSTTSLHVIRQQFLHVEVEGTESDGLALQRILPTLCEHYLTPALDAALERCTPLNGHLAVECLEIDAGIFTLEGLERELAESVARAIEKSLREEISRSQVVPAMEPRNVERRTEQQSVGEALVYFLRTGSLPWWFRLPQGRGLEQVVLDLWQGAAEKKVPLPALDDKVLRALAPASARQRLVWQFSPAFLGALLARLSPEGKKLMDSFLLTLRLYAEPAVGTKLLERALWEVVFADVAAGRTLTSAGVVDEAWDAVAAAIEMYPALTTWLELHRPGALDTARATSSHHLEPPALRHAGSPNTNADSGEYPDSVEGIYIENAGLVLLHPFLPQFFTALAVATEDKILQPARALCLLHFLTSGQPIAPEYELILARILCNVPLQTPVEADVDLTNYEKEEAIALLEAVIRHWDVLGKTSPDGLRGTFLLRPGKVSLREDGDWRLQVESKGYDILMDQLPWSVSMIKLPWMEKILWVEWRM